MSHQLHDFKINDTRPFLGHADCASERLDEAHALLLLLSDVYRMSPEGSCDDDINSLNNTIKADAFRGICTLVALAQYHTAESRAEKQAKPAAVAA
jgi:hypothetical protein